MINFKKLLLLLLILLPIPGHALDQYPTKTVRIILPFSVGTSGDIIMRTIAQRLSEMYGQQFVIDNRDGGLGIPATQIISRSEPDGYTLFFTGINHVTNLGLRDKLPYDTSADFAPISLIAVIQTALVVSKKSDIKDYKEFIKKAKANPGELTFASAGAGTGGHLSMEMFSQAMGISMRHIPYRGATGALNDVAGGQVDGLFTGIAAAMPLAQQGQLTVLVVSGSKKSPAFPNAPSLSELGLSQYDVQTWFGLLGRAGTPQNIIQRLSADISSILREPAVIERFNSLSITPVGSSPQEFDAIIKKDIGRWPKLIRELGVTSQ